MGGYKLYNWTSSHWDGTDKNQGSWLPVGSM